MVENYFVLNVSQQKYLVITDQLMMKQRKNMNLFTAYKQF